jgi:hypothetical protein
MPRDVIAPAIQRRERDRAPATEVQQRDADHASETPVEVTLRGVRRSSASGRLAGSQMEGERRDWIPLPRTINPKFHGAASLPARSPPPTQSLHTSASLRPGTNSSPHSTHGCGSCFTRRARLSVSRSAARHFRTASLWHPRHYDESPSNVLELAGNTSEAPGFRTFGTPSRPPQPPPARSRPPHRVFPCFRRWVGPGVVGAEAGGNHAQPLFRWKGAWAGACHGR